MTTLSTAAWAAHELGLATAIGGTLYGRAALEPALHELEDAATRDRVSVNAWQRFSWLNLVAHGVVAATWFTGRAMLSGREVSRTACRLTSAKDGLVIGSLLTGLGSIVLGRLLARRIRRREAGRSRLAKAVGSLGFANLLVNVAIVGVTTVLAMEGNKSARFILRSRRLP